MSAGFRVARWCRRNGPVGPCPFGLHLPTLVNTSTEDAATAEPTAASQSETTYAADLGRALRAARLRRGWSLAYVEGISDGRLTADVVRAYEHGALPITVMHLDALASFYRVDPGSLLPERRSGGGPVSRARGVAHRRAHPPIVVDVDALHRRHDNELIPLRRFVGTIRAQRRQLGAPRVTIRGDDLPALAAVSSCNVAGFVGRLRWAGVLAS